MNLQIALELLTAIIVFFIIDFVCYYLTEKREMPQFLDYKPFNCRKCFTFWTSETTFLVLGVSLNAWWLMSLGIVLTSLNAIAMHIDEKRKTVTLEEWKNMKK